MIERERLEELIAQEKGCYITRDYQIGYVHFDKKYEPELYANGEDNCFLYIYTNNEFKYKEEIFGDQLFETKEEAEWYLEFGNIERTEKLTLPTWEEFKKEKYYSFVASNYTYYNITMRYNKICMEYSLDDEYYREDNDWEKIDATKENYIKACRLAKKLFLGESE